jgi:hypothetical protein
MRTMANYPSWFFRSLCLEDEKPPLSSHSSISAIVSMASISLSIPCPANSIPFFKGVTSSTSSAMIVIHRLVIRVFLIFMMRTSVRNMSSSSCLLPCNISKVWCEGDRAKEGINDRFSPLGLYVM